MSENPGRFPRGGDVSAGCQFVGKDMSEGISEDKIA